MSNQTYFFCGIGGAGMSPLARLLAKRGTHVIGSDRSYDTGSTPQLFSQLASEGIKLVPQDGSHVTPAIGTFVVTRAVEESIPDIKKARELDLKILKRPLLMAQLFKDTENIAVGGTSGKSTTTGMIAHILTTVGRSPTVMNGATMINYNSNFIDGESSLAVFEADESDGDEDVIAVCPAHVAVLTNISLDHFSLDELNRMFGGYIRNAKLGAVLNADCPNSMTLRQHHANTVTFGRDKTADFSPEKFNLKLTIPGEHNILNGLAAAAACSLIGVPAERSIEALETFKGIKRRLELVGTIRDIRIIDDFASNPGKIFASVKTAQQGSRRTVVIFQPHGFQPTKMMKQGYIDSFIELLGPDDILLMPDIYYAGGSANLVNGQLVALPTDISSKDITDAVTAGGRQAQYIGSRESIIPYLKGLCQPGDTIIVMGSRDLSLSDFAAEIFQQLSAS